MQSFRRDLQGWMNYYHTLEIVQKLGNHFKDGILSNTKNTTLMDKKDSIHH